MYPVQVALSLHHPIVSSTATPSSSSREQLAATATPPISDWSQEARQRDYREEGVPLVVLVEPSILGILPISLLPTVMALLGVPGAAAGACIVLR